MAPQTLSLSPWLPLYPSRPPCRAHTYEALGPSPIIPYPHPRCVQVDTSLLLCLQEGIELVTAIGQAEAAARKVSRLGIVLTIRLREGLPRGKIRGGWRSVGNRRNCRMPFRGFEGHVSHTSLK